MPPHGGLRESLGESPEATQLDGDFINPDPPGSLSGGGFA